MLLYQYEQFTIFFQEKDKMFVCYKDNQFHRHQPYHKPVTTLFQLKDDAMTWFDEWVNKKPKPNYLVADVEDSAQTMASFRNCLYTTE